MNFEERTTRYRNIINGSLSSAMLLPDTPETLKTAMRYSLEAGGKRLRPCLTLGVCDIMGGNRKMAIKLACGIEMIHTYSLIHDDLPCMDNDDMRRGKPSNHKAFGEGQAVLAGDGLLTYAFQFMLEAGLSFNKMNYYRAVAEIARRAGAAGMVAGQSMDLIAAKEGIKSEDELNYIHRHKTADMLIASVLAGAFCGSPTDIQLKSLENYAEEIGVLFQITDDLLDAAEDGLKEAGAGGDANSDTESKPKLTYVSLYGKEKSLEIAEKTADDAERILFNTFGENCGYLYDTVHYILERAN